MRNFFLHVLMLVKRALGVVYGMVSKKSNIYVTREQLIREIILSKKKYRESNEPRTPAECFTPELIKYLQLLVNKYANKGSWRNYTYLDDMKSEALLTLCQNAFKYDETRYDNPFGYYTQIIKYSFITSLEREEITRDIKDSLWESIGMTPSYARQIRNEMLREIGDTSNKGLKLLKKEADLMSDRIGRMSHLNIRLNKLKAANPEIDAEIAEILEIEPLAFTGNREAALSLFPSPPEYSVSVGVTINNEIVDCLSLRDPHTNSNSLRILPNISDEAVSLALCLIGWSIRRDLLVKRFREISGYNILPARYPAQNSHTEPAEPEETIEYPTHEPRGKKRGPRRSG